MIKPAVIAKTVFSTLVSCAICFVLIPAALGSNVSAMEVNDQQPVRQEESESTTTQDKTTYHTDNGSQWSTDDMSGAQGQEIPKTLHEDDGTTWTMTDSYESDDGSISAYSYTDGNDVQFDDGGLGEAELIITN